MTDDKALNEKLKFKELQNEVTRRRWQELLEEGKEFELMQEQMHVGANTVKDLAGVILASNRLVLKNIAEIESRLDQIELSLGNES